MKKTLFLGLFLAASFFAYSQGNTLYRVDVVKPKSGMRAAFEAGWKLHLDLFHKTKYKQTVYQITNGPDLGAYVIVQGPMSWASLDTVRPDAKAHGLDVDKLFTKTEEGSSRNMILRWVDTLSRNSTVQAEKFIATTTVIKNGKMGEYLAEVRRTVLIQDKLNLPSSTNRLTQMLAGSSPTLVTMTNLKDGFAQLEGGPNNPNFRAAYISEYGQDAWDSRLKILVDDVVSSRSNMQILRPDLSSK